jgi:hypothetical protein
LRFLKSWRSLRQIDPFFKLLRLETGEWLISNLQSPVFL